ncbi:MAG: hypothetical protein ABW182_13680 [Sphingomonas sp.]
MLTSLALMAQTATLDADPYDAARTCAMASVRANGAETPEFVETARFVFYLMHADRARSEGKTFIRRMEEIVDDRPADMTPTESRAVLPECEKRFAPVTMVRPEQLPRRQVDRDTMCLAVLYQLQFQADLVRRYPKDDWADWIKSTTETINARLSQVKDSPAEAKSQDEFVAYHDRLVRASLDLGEPLAVARACGLKGN